MSNDTLHYRIIQDTVVEVVSALNAAAIDYVICGGIAVAMHGHPRATQDVDILVQSDQEIERLNNLLQPAGWLRNPEEIPLKNSHIVRFIKPIGDRMAILNAIVGGEDIDGIIKRGIKDTYNQLECRLIALEDLFAMKRQSGRLQDLADIENLGGTV